jgi:hypothetical protein
LRLLIEPRPGTGPYPRSRVAFAGAGSWLRHHQRLQGDQLFGDQPRQALAQQAIQCRRILTPKPQQIVIEKIKVSTLFCAGNAGEFQETLSFTFGQDKAGGKALIMKTDPFVTSQWYEFLELAGFLR